MCGIVGMVGVDDAAHRVMDGLRRLEYRGYDSSGIAVLNGVGLQLCRRPGKLSELESALDMVPLAGRTALGHTRWATHGRPCEINAHPHAAGDVAVVHNGIVENFRELRRDLEDEGVKVVSDTDSELIAHVIARTTGPTLEGRVREALARVKGAYAIAVISERDPDEIVVAKNASPLIIGVSNEMGLIASDIPALLPYTRHFMVMEEGEIASVRPNRITISTTSGERVHREVKHVEWPITVAEKGGHEHFMHKEIYEQPEAIRATLRERLALEGSDAEVTFEPELHTILAGADRLLITACGTSFHAAMLGKHLFQELAGVPADVELASELRYAMPPLIPNTVAIGISQSGETADTLAATRELRRRGAKVASVVNVMDSSLARESDAVLYTRAGPEIGVASTKAFTTQVAALALMALAMGRARGMSAKRAREIADGLRSIPSRVEMALSCEGEVQRIAKRMASARSALFLGRGYGHPLALEGALKLKEISYIHAEGYAAGEMKHGPIALIEADVPVVFIATMSAVLEKLRSNMEEARARGGWIVSICGAGEAEDGADHIEVPRVDPVLAPLVDAIPLQLLAYHVARERGADIDQPRNLAKSVTVE